MSHLIINILQRVLFIYLFILNFFFTHSSISSCVSTKKISKDIEQSNAMIKWKYTLLLLGTCYVLQDLLLRVFRSDVKKYRFRFTTNIPKCQDINSDIYYISINWKCTLNRWKQHICGQMSNFGQFLENGKSRGTSFGKTWYSASMTGLTILCCSHTKK